MFGPQDYNFNERRFRLRLGRRVVGYMRKISKSTIFYSRDSFWWNGTAIPYQEIDEWTGLKDKNGQYIYEWDILYYKLDPDSDYLKGVVLWEGNEKVFGIRGLEDQNFIPLFVQDVMMFNPRQLNVFSYLYLNPDLQRQLGVSER
jgi:hypothetical protein